MAEHCLDEESIVKEVLVISARYDKESFHYHLVMLLTYPCFWRVDMLIDHPSTNKQYVITLPTTFADKPFSSWIRQYGATSLTHISF